MIKDQFKSHRKNSFEVLAYDFVIDEQLDVWLMEVNQNPNIKRVQGNLATGLLKDLLKVTIDWKGDNSADTGGWKLIN